MSDNAYQLYTNKGEVVPPQKSVDPLQDAIKLIQRLTYRVEELEKSVDQIESAPPPTAPLNVTEGIVTVQQLAAQVWLAMQPMFESRLQVAQQNTQEQMRILVESIQHKYVLNVKDLDFDDLMERFYQDISNQEVIDALIEKKWEQLVIKLMNDGLTKAVAEEAASGLDGDEFSETVATALVAQMKISFRHDDER